MTQALFRTASTDGDVLHTLDAAGLTSADIVVLDATELMRQGPLVDWVEAGGVVLALAREAHADKRYSSAFAATDALPVTPAGVTQLPAWAIAGSPETPDDPMVTVVRCEPKPGARVLASFGGVPLAVAKRHGLGQVIYIPFDPSTRSLGESKQYVRFWRDVLQSVAGRDRALDRLAERGSTDTALAGISESNSQISPPSAGLIAGFLGLYILLLVPVNYLVLRTLRRRELAWATVPILVIVFSLFAYMSGSSGRGARPTINSVAVVEAAAGAENARVVGTLSLYSPARTRYDLSFSDDSLLVSDRVFSVMNEGFPTLRTVHGPELRLPDTDVYMWSTRTLVLEAIRKLDGRVVAHLATDGRRVRGVIANELPFALRDCTLYGDRFRTDIGTFESGQSVAVSQAFEDYLYLKELKTPLAGQEPARLMRCLNFLIGKSLPALVQPGELMLVGWTERPQWDLRVGGSKMVSTETALIFVHIRPEWESLPGGVISGAVGGRVYDVGDVSEVANYSGAEDASQSNRLQVRSVPTARSPVTLHFELPKDAQSCLYSELSLEWYAKSRADEIPRYEGPRQLTNVETEALVYDYPARLWRSVGVAKKVGQVSVAIPQPERAVGPGGFVKVKLQPGKSSAYARLFNLRLHFEGHTR